MATGASGHIASGQVIQKDDLKLTLDVRSSILAGTE